MQAQFLTPASQEFLAAVDFYEAQAPGLGDDFILDVECSLRLLAEFPGLGSRGPAGTRRIPLHRFPFSLVYILEPDTIRVVAVEHQRRRPGYWRDRV